ncbi:type II toxin-antitoxin system RelE/ParE family toxin [Pseudomonas gingeri]
MKLEWTHQAREDRDGIFDFIEQDNPRAAIKTDDRIDEQVKRLLLFPESGRLGRIPGTRELVIDLTPYIVAYCINDHCIRVLRVLHGAQLWPDTIPSSNPTTS